MAAETVEPFGVRLRRLRAERELSQEALAFSTWVGEQRLSAGAIGQFERGVAVPRPETMRRLAHALDVDPEAFGEYRLAEARRLLDEREIGLEAALATLERIEPALYGPSPEELAQLGDELEVDVRRHADRLAQASDEASERADAREARAPDRGLVPRRASGGRG